MADTMRGWLGGERPTSNQILYPNLSNAEVNSTVFLGTVFATGFKPAMDGGTTSMYIAIRRPMKVPEAGTEVFAVDTKTTGNPNWDSNFPVDFSIFKQDITGSYDNLVFSRLTGNSYVKANASQDKRAGGTDFAFDYMDGWGQDGSTSAVAFSWMFKRATGFMDVVCYTGNATANRQITHNLNAVPELMLAKTRDASNYWVTYDATNGATNYMVLNTVAASASSIDHWYNTTPTASVVTLGDGNYTNRNATEQILYLFATVAGVSKVGTYTADGTLTTINCGFSAGARFILIKRTDAEESWFLYDSLQGITAGNDPYLRLNADYGQVTGTDYIDPDSSGFQLTAAGSSTINVDTGTYIFLAIA